MVILIPTSALQGHGSTAWPAGVPHLDQITLDPTWASSGHGSTAWPAGWTQLDLVSLVPTWHHRDMVPLHGLQVASPGPFEWGCHLGLTHSW